MRIGIIGAGAVGMLIAGYTGKTHDVRIYSRRSNQKESIKENGICVYPSPEMKLQTNVNVHQLHKEIALLDCCFISVKQPNLPDLTETIQRFPKELPLIFIQNGMSHLEILERLQQPVYIGIVEHGANRLSDYEVEHKGKGKILLASYSGEEAQLKQLTNQLNQSEFPFEQVTDWQKVVKNKILVNSVINPLTALFQVSNEAILTNEHIYKLAQKLCRESATALDMDEKAAWENVVNIVLQTGKNSSSMLQDIQGGRKTEIRSISGYLQQESTEPLPYTSFVHEAILALERKGKPTWKN